MERGTGKPRLAWTAVLAACAAVLFALPASAGAVVPGPNGFIFFTSGRDSTTTNYGDANSQIWRIPAVANGTAVQVTSLNDTKQHRHPTISPDRRFLAYARCKANACGGTGPWSIVIEDLVLGSKVDITTTITNSGTADRPSFSPDGQRIAYGRKPDNVGETFNIYTQPVNNGSGSPGAEDPTVASANDDEKPTWSADSQTIYYSENTGAGNLRDIRRVPATGGASAGVITTTDDDYQPGVSPNGDRLCFVRGAFGSDDAEVKTAALPTPGAIGDVSPDDNVGSYNCVWSPDQTKIAYANGIFTNGALVMRNADGTGSVTTITNVTTPTLRFDGNPDWASNGSPTCTDGNVTVAFNSFVSIPLNCADTGPNYEQTGVTESVVANPANGNLGAIQQGDPSTVIYTPNLNFSGTDSFTFKGNDGTSDSNTATINITVNGPTGGGGGGGGGTDTAAAVISSAAVSPSRWRRGSLLARLLGLRRAPVGTTIRFRLNEAARVSLTFAKTAAGRRVGRRCVRPTRANRTRPRCTRYLTRGTLRFNGKVGLNRIRFQGRLSRTRTLGLGRHRVTIGATDTAGNRSRTRSVFFTIVRR